MRKIKYILLSVVILVFALGLSACQQESVPNYTVRFDSLCDINIPQQLVKRGDKIVKPEGLYRENFELEGWYVSRDFGEDTRWSFAGHTVTSNMTLYANWTRLPTAGLFYFKLENENGYRVSVGDAIAEKDILIASKYNGLPVTSISRMAFFSCVNLISITIPDSVTDIGESAFEQCDKLTNVIIPNSVTNIGDGAFYNCGSLVNIAIPDSVINIGNAAFASCTNLKSITIPDSVAMIKNDAFSDCSSLSIYIEGSLSTEWEGNWNSYYRPEIRGCCVSSDRTHIIYLIWTEESIVNPQNFTINAPYRKGYAFGGWTGESGSTVAEYSAEDIESVPYISKLYAIWIKN